MSTGINGHDIYCGTTYQNLLDADKCPYCARLGKARTAERRRVEEEWSTSSALTDDIAYRQGREDAAMAIAVMGATPHYVRAARGEA